jgi:hypothetical protein
MIIGTKYQNLQQNSTQFQRIYNRQKLEHEGEWVAPASPPTSSVTANMKHEKGIDNRRFFPLIPMAVIVLDIIK